MAPIILELPGLMPHENPELVKLSEKSTGVKLLCIIIPPSPHTHTHVTQREAEGKQLKVMSSFE